MIRTALGLMLLVCITASAEERMFVSVHDGWPRVLTELPKALETGEAVWTWSSSCGPSRIEVAELPPCSGTEEVELHVSVPRQESAADLEVRWGTEAMLREIPDDLLPLARSGEDGVVRLPIPQGETVFARVAGPHLASGWRRVGHRENLLAVPATRPSIALIEDGSPAKRGWIEIRTRDVASRENLPFRAAAAGRVTIPPIPAGSFVRVIAWSEAGAPAVLNARADAIPESIELARGHGIRGVLVDEKNVPVSNADVTVMFTIPRDRIDIQKVRRSAADGGFSIQGLPAGDTEFVIDRQPYARSSQIVRIAADLDLGSFTLLTARNLSVKVTSEQGAPIKGARVRTTDGVSAETSEAGLAKLRSIPASSVTARVTARGYLPRDVSFAADAKQPLVIDLRRAVHVRARLVDAAGLTTVAGGTIGINLSGRTSVVEFEGDEIDIDNLDAGVLALEIRAASLSPFRVPERRVVAGEVVDLGIIALDRGLAVIGRAVDAASLAPLSGVTFRILRPNPSGALLSWFRHDFVSAQSGEDGRFRVPGLAPGTYSLWTEAAGRAPRIKTNLEVSGDQPGGELDLGDLTIEAGRRVVVTCTPEARCGAEASVTLPEAEWFPISSPVREGRAEISPLPTGTAILRLSDRGGVIHRRELTIGPNDVTDVRIQLEGVAVTGLVLRGGHPVRGGLIAFEPPGDGSRVIQVAQRRSSGVMSNEIVGNISRRITTQADDDGRFELEDVAPGEYMVTWSSAGSPSTPRRVYVPDGVTTVPLRVELGSSGLAGHVRRDDGRPVSGIAVTAQTATGSAQTLTGASGDFSFGALDAGQTVVRASSREDGAAEATVQVREDRTTQVDLTLGAESLSELRVFVQFRGQPVANAFVFVRANGRTGSVTTGADGRATIRQIDPTGVREVAVYSGHLGWSFVPARSASGQELTIDMSGGAAGLTVFSNVAAPLMITAPTGFPLQDALAILGSRPFARPDTPATLNRLPPGTYMLSVGAVVKNVTIGAESRELRF